MTKKEAAIVASYTGYLIGKFGEMQKYVDSLVGYPTFTHQYANDNFSKRIQELSKKDFCNIKIKD